MIYVGYHGTSEKIEYWDLDHRESGQGNSIFPGIYFSSTYKFAKQFADLSSKTTGGKPIVYVAECNLERPLDLRKGSKVFNSFSDIDEFCKKYFPDWYDSDGNLYPHKVGYVREKFSTYSGQYSLIKYAAKENRLDLFEVISELGFDSCVDNGEFVVTSPQQILSFEEVDHQLPEEDHSATESYSAFETKANDYIRASKVGKNYKTMPGNRFMRRVLIQTNGGNNIWFDIDINRLFKKGSFAVKVPVIGETDTYTVTISFEDWLPFLKNAIANTGFSQMTVKRSLSEMMRFHDLKLKCTCKDFIYRHKYWLSVHNEIEGDPELRPSNVTNPHDDLGKICKHLAMCLNNKSVYFDKVSRIIYNYFINLKGSQPALFDRVIAPKLGLNKPEEPPKEDTLETNNQELKPEEETTNDIKPEETNEGPEVQSNEPEDSNNPDTGEVEDDIQ